MKTEIDQMIERLRKCEFPSRKDFHLIEAVREYDWGAEPQVIIDVCSRMGIGEAYYQAVMDACRDYDRGGPYARKN